MSEIPSEFFSKQSFKSLPRLAFLTWLFVFIIDAVLLQRLPYDFIRVLYVWVIGFIISFLFELARYKNLEQIEKKDYRKYFMVLNAFIIFLYASSYTGLTKQIGAWGELQNNVNKEARLEEVKKEEKAGIFLLVIEWAIPVLAKQTSYFPDVTAIAENKELKEENFMLRNGTVSVPPDNNIINKDSLQKVITDLETRTGSLIDSLRNCERVISDYNQKSEQVRILLDRINTFNNRQSDWNNKFGPNMNAGLKEIMDSRTKDNTWFEFFFRTPIDNSLK